LFIGGFRHAYDPTDSNHEQKTQCQRSAKTRGKKKFDKLIHAVAFNWFG
jgi:hypothetical protein